MQGVVPSLVMVANPAVQYALYEWLTALARRRAAPRAAGAAALPTSARAPRPIVLSSGAVFALSALAKLGATLVTYPLLVVKNRIQARCHCASNHCQTFVQR